VTSAIDVRRLVPEVLVSPQAHSLDNGLRAATVIAERVLDARRNLGVDVSVDQAGRLKLAQGAGQHLVGHVRDEPLQIAEPARAVREPVEHDQVPPAAQDFDCGRQRAPGRRRGGIFGVRQ
jgi:hypothetical protein